MHIPMSLRIAPMPDDATVQAVMFGPLVLAGLLGGEGLTMENTHSAENWYRFDHPAEAPIMLLEPNAKVEDWIQPVADKPLTFKTVGVGHPRDVTLIPYYKLFDQQYAIYWNVYRRGTAEYEAYLRAEEAKKREEARRVDWVDLENPESERVHDLQGEQSHNGLHQGRAWRDAAPGGWFSYRLQTPSDDRPVVLAVTYWGSDTGRREFDILIDGRKIATQKLDQNRPDEFFQVEYPLAADLLKNKEKIEVRFQGLPECMTGGVFGVAVLKAEGAE
jgi:uncharacterized protein